jgi:hypothetical protein
MGFAAPVLRIAFWARIRGVERLDRAHGTLFGLLLPDCSPKQQQDLRPLMRDRS